MVVMIRALANLYGFSMKVSVLKSAQNFLGSLYEYVNKIDSSSGVDSESRSTSG